MLELCFPPTLLLLFALLFTVARAEEEEGGEEVFGGELGGAASSPWTVCTTAAGALRCGAPRVPRRLVRCAAQRSAAGASLRVGGRRAV